FFAQKIKADYKDHVLLREEGYGDNLKDTKGTVWIIDQIDGTMNIVNQKRNIASSIGINHKDICEIGFVYDIISNNLYSEVSNNGEYKNNKKLPMLPKNIKLEESVICLNHYWLCENRHVNEKVMQSLVKDVRGTRTYGSAALEFA